MGIEVDPLTSEDGTPVRVEKQRKVGRVRTFDEDALEHLESISMSLKRIVTMLEFEFEHNVEYLDGQD